LTPIGLAGAATKAAGTVLGRYLARAPVSYRRSLFAPTPSSMLGYQRSSGGAHTLPPAKSKAVDRRSVGLPNAGRASPACCLVNPAPPRRSAGATRCHSTAPVLTHLFRAESITAATASSTAAYSLASVLSRATRASSWFSKSTKLCGGGSVRSYWSRSAAPIIVPAAPKGRLPLKSSCRMWNRYVPKHKRQRGVASVVPGRATHNRKGGRGAEQSPAAIPVFFAAMPPTPQPASLQFPYAFFPAFALVHPSAISSNFALCSGLHFFDSRCAEGIAASRQHCDCQIDGGNANTMPPTWRSGP
jgi:hypothetical protein